MIEILTAPDNVVAMRTGGVLDGADYDRVVAHVDEKLASHAKIGLVAVMTDFHGLTPEALWKDLQYNLRRISEWSRFPRCALVTDAAWLKAMAAFWNPLVPGVEIKVFAPGELDQATAWAADITA